MLVSGDNKIIRLLTCKAIKELLENNPDRRGARARADGRVPNYGVGAKVMSRDRRSDITKAIYAVVALKIARFCFKSGYRLSFAIKEFN